MRGNRLVSGCLVACAVLAASLSTLAQHRDRDAAANSSVVRIGVLAKPVEGKARLADFRVLEPKHELPFPDTTCTYPEWPWAKTRETSDDLAHRVAIALMSLTADSAAARAAKCPGWSVPLEYQEVHACLRDIGLPLAEPTATSTTESEYRK